MRTPRMDERGIALVVAIFALVVIGALVAGTFLVGRLEQRMGDNTVYATEAAEAADAGLAAALEEDQSVYSGIANAWPLANSEVALPVVTLAGNPAAPSLRATRVVRRLNNNLFLVFSTGERRSSTGTVLATSQHGLLVRIQSATIPVTSAITVMQPVKLNGNAFSVNGNNSNPTNWDQASAGWTACSPTDAIGHGDGDVVGIRSATTTGVNNKDTNQVKGYPTPAVEGDSTITSSTFRDFVDKTFASMSKQPGVKVLPLDTPYNGIGPVVTNGTCDKAAPYNFGEPTHPSASYSACYNYFPVVNGTGGQTKFAAGSRGQGTLLVEGDLEINGGFEWTGLIIVRGSFKINGTGNKIIGAVLAESVTDDNSIGGNVDIKYSSCAIDKALKGSSTAAPLNRRSWLQLY